MLDVKLLSGNLPAKATNYRTHVAEGLADDLPYFSIYKAHLMYNAHPKLFSTFLLR
jgi:hypothetical protein